MVGYSWVLKQTTNHAGAPVVCWFQQLIWFYSSGHILLVVVGFLIVEQILSVLVNLLHCVCNFSSTTSNVFSKLSKSWRDPWWRTYVSIFFCLTNLQGNQRQAQSTSLLPQACVLQQLYNLKSVMLLCCDELICYFATNSNETPHEKIGCSDCLVLFCVFLNAVCLLSLSQGLRCHRFLCQQSVWDGKKKAAIPQFPGFCFLCRSAYQQLDSWGCWWVLSFDSNNHLIRTKVSLNTHSIKPWRR